jgi:hypothetical protein
MKNPKSNLDVGEELRHQHQLKKMVEELNEAREYHEEIAKALGCSPEASAMVSYLVKKGVI